MLAKFGKFLRFVPIFDIWSENIAVLRVTWLPEDFNDLRFVKRVSSCGLLDEALASKTTIASARI